jgi:solute carrier family 25 carnitine/acylcarnitine transporter 20/29
VVSRTEPQRRAALAGSISKAASGAPEEFYKGSVDCFKQVLSKHGVKGLYRGFTSTILRDMQVRKCRTFRCSPVALK